MIKEAIGKLVEGQSLSEPEAQQVLGEVMEGTATTAQLGAFLVALRLKGVTQEELLGLVRTMRAKATPVHGGSDLLDTCGTGGDGTGTFNISTGAGLVAAAAGAKVAKHGNRSASSKCGSADVLEALGAKLALTPAQAEESLDKVGFAFLFAQAYHPAMRFAGPTRAEIGIRTVFNFMGPLSNPANPAYQLLGEPDPAMLPKMAYVLRELGLKHAMVVCAEDGLDEISLSAPTHVQEIRNGAISSYTITADGLGLKPSTIKDLEGGDKEQNARIMRALFAGETGPKRDSLLANAGAALYVAGKAQSVKDGVALAARTIDSGAAQQKLDAYIKVTQGFAA